MKNRLKNIKIITLALSFVALAGCTGGASGACKYEQVFGIAKINTIEKQIAKVSFTVQNENGKSSSPSQSLTIPVPWGVKAGEEYPALLHLYKSGPISCEKEKLIIIQAIGEACKVQ